MAKKKAEENFSILDKGLTIDGNLTSKGKLLIKGNVKGVLDGEYITIGEEGVVSAQTQALSLTVGGKLEGEVEVKEKLIVLSTGSCEGKIVCRDLVVEPGGILNGQVTRLIPPEPTPSSPAPPETGGFMRRKKR